MSQKIRFCNFQFQKCLKKIKEQGCLVENRRDASRDHPESTPTDVFGSGLGFSGTPSGRYLTIPGADLVLQRFSSENSGGRERSVVLFLRCFWRNFHLRASDFVKSDCFIEYDHYKSDCIRKTRKILRISLKSRDFSRAMAHPSFKKGIWMFHS